MGASSIPGDFNPHGYPQYMKALSSIYLTVAVGKSGSLTIGDKIRGRTSRATGVFNGWSGSNSERIKVTHARPGPYGKPFLPGEIIEQIADPSNTVTVANSPLATTQSAVRTETDT